MNDELLKMIPGVGDVADWFGRWPTFHDAEISKLQLHPNRVCTFNVYAWNMTREVDEKGFYRNEKYADVEFRLEDVSTLNITDLTETGILFDLMIQPRDKDLVITLSSSYGTNGMITCERCSLKLKLR